MGYGTIFLEALLGLFLLLTGCLVLRTMMLEIPRTFHPRKDTPNAAGARDSTASIGLGDRLDRFVADIKTLETNGLTAREIAALLHLKRWYEVGEGDRAMLLSRWEFLKQLLRDGKLEV